MKNLIFSLILTILVSGCANDQPYPWNKEVPFQSVLDKANGQLVLLDFFTTWCGPCKMMDENTFTDSKVKSFANKNLVSMKIDAEKGEGIELAERYNIRGYPTFVFVNGQGEEVDRVVGYREPDNFLSELERIQSGKNTLPVLLEEFQLNPTSFNTLFKLAKKYQNMDDLGSAKRMANAILAANVDSAGTAAFLTIYYGAKVTRDPNPLIAYADENPESDYAAEALEEALWLVRIKREDTDLEANLFLRVINSMKEPNPSMMNSFAWRMSELEMNLDMALEKITWAIYYEPNEKRKHMFIDTKAEVLFKMGRVDDAISEVEKCIEFDPEYQHYQEQLEKFKQAKMPA